MRHIKTFAILLGVALLQSCSSPRQAAKATEKITASCPDATRILPGYPSFEDKAAFYNDSLLYERGKALRGTERGKQAVKDADMQLDFYLKRYGDVMGVTLSEQGTPATAECLKALFAFTGQGIKNAKGAFERERPFRHFNEPSAVPADENGIGRSSSYPSGHAIIAWVAALALSSIDEAHQYEILKLGYELGQSRVIVGFHYQSDVDAGRLLASAVYARIVSDPAFIKLMDAAREELKAKKGF